MDLVGTGLGQSSGWGRGIEIVPGLNLTAEQGPSGGPQKGKWGQGVLVNIDQ